MTAATCPTQRALSALLYPLGGTATLLFAVILYLEMQC